MGAATPVGELLLKSLRLLAGPGVHLAGSEHAGSSFDLKGIKERPRKERAARHETEKRLKSQKGEANLKTGRQATRYR